MTNKGLKRGLRWLVGIIVVSIMVAAWVVYFHNDAVAGVLPKWDWLQGTLKKLGQPQEVVAAEDEDPDNTKNEIPVHTGHIAKATLRRYIEGGGTVSPRPQRGKEMAASAAIAAPVAGVVRDVLCQTGQVVKAGDPLLQLDDRVAKAAVVQAEAGVKDAEAAVAALSAGPKPAQLQIAQIAIDKSQGAVAAAQRAYDRAKQLAAETGASVKSVEQAASDLASAQNDLQANQRQLDLLKSPPTKEELAQAQAKQVEAEAALSTAKVQADMLTVKSPLDGAVMSVAVNPGEAVDPTKTVVQVTALDRLMVDVDVPADELGAEAMGLKAEVLLSGAHWPEDSEEGVVTGKVAAVSPQVDVKTGAVQVEVDLPADAKVRPGLWVRVRIVAEQHEDVLAAPENAVVQDENGDWVIATLEGDQATHKSVKVGLREKGLVEITADGIKEGDTVVTAGAYGLPQATRVKVVD